MFLVDFFRAVYKVVEVFFLYSPSRFIYSTVIFAVALFFLIRHFVLKRKAHTLLLVISLVLFFFTFVVPWQNWVI